MKVTTAVQEALGILGWGHPFWATLLYETLQLKMSEEVPTLGVGGGVMHINDGYFSQLSQPKRIAALAHEVGHEMLLHPEMMQKLKQEGLDGEPFDFKRFNFAADYAINDMLKQSGVGELDESWLWTEHFTWDDSVYDIYRRLKPVPPPQPPPGGDGGGQGQEEKNPPPPSGLGGSGGGAGQEDASADESGSQQSGPGKYAITDKQGNTVGYTPDVGSSQDTHMFDEHTGGRTAEDWKQAIAAAHESAKAMGKGSAFLDRMVEGLLTSKRDWKQELRDYVVVHRGRETRNWRRIHKRKMYERGLALPTRLSHRIGDVLFVFDVSGSVSTVETRAALSAAHGICNDCKPKSIRAMSVAGHVITDDTFTDVASFLSWWPSGTGGTDMEAAFRKVKDEGWTPELAVVLTDGYTPFTDPPRFPVVWLSTQKSVDQYPYGHAILIEVE